MKKILLIILSVILTPIAVFALSSTVYRSGDNYGIGTTSPYALLSVHAPDASTFFAIGSSTATRLQVDDTTFQIQEGAFKHTYATSLTEIDSLEVGPMSLEDNGGILSWIDMDVSTTTASLVESYTAQLDGNLLITVYGLTDGSGGVINLGVGIATATPAYTLDVYGNMRVDGDLTVTSANITNLNATTSLDYWGTTSTGMTGNSAIITVGLLANGTLALDSLSFSGTLDHEYGGLEVDASAYAGLIAITGGATAEVNSLAEINALLPGETIASTTVENLNSLNRYWTMEISTSTIDFDSQWVIEGATSTLERIGTAMTITELNCKTNIGTAAIQIGDGSASTTYKSFGTTAATQTYSSGNSFTKNEDIFIAVQLSDKNTVAECYFTLNTD